MKTIIISISIIAFFPMLVFSQQINNDYLVTDDNDTIKCKVIRVEGKKVEYIKNGESSSSRKSILKFIDAKINDLNVIDNPLNIKIEKPEPGYAHIYFYRPYVYTGSALPCNIEYNGEKFINIKTNSYYLQKVKANEIHKYNWKHTKKDIIEVNAKDGQIYFIRGTYGTYLIPGGSSSMYGNEMSIFIDNPNIAQYIILTMNKISPTN